MSTLLIVDDDAETVRFMEELLAEPGRQILSAGTPDRALALVREHEVDVVVSDIHLNADRSGLDLLRAVRSGGHPARVVLISGFGTLETAIDAVRHGAFDYVSKPFKPEEVVLVLKKAEERRRLVTENRRLRRSGTDRDPLARIVGSSEVVKQLHRQILKVAPVSSTVLITGESGTGKELVARALHELSPRAAMPFVPVNCGAIPPGLVESELFGHARGAFTDARTAKRGLFAEADGGTLLLDEAGELEDPDVLLDPVEGEARRPCELAQRRGAAAQALENAPPCGIRERKECRVERLQ